MKKEASDHDIFVCAKVIIFFIDAAPDNAIPPSGRVNSLQGSAAGLFIRKGITFCFRIFKIKL